MPETHNLTTEERDHIDALIKSFDNHGCGFGQDILAQAALRLLLDRLDDANQAINAFEVEQKFFPADYRDKLEGGENVAFFHMNTDFYRASGPNYRTPRFSLDAAQRLYCGQSVTYINLQLAFYMGFTEVYLIGMDFSYTIPASAIIDGLSITSTEDDPNHFHPDYFGTGKKWHDPQLDQVRKCYEHAKKVFEEQGRCIYNASKGGKLEVFPRVEYDRLFETRVGS